MSDEIKADELQGLIDKDRHEHPKKEWEGPFFEYLEIVRKNPSVAQLAHNRLYSVLIKPGSRSILETDDPRIKRLFDGRKLMVYNFFSDFYGIEEVVGKFVSYFHSASLKGEESRQVLYLMGPVGSGKSSLAEALKNGLKNSEPFYAIKNCPMHEEPLHLFPQHLRKAFEEKLGVIIEGDLCPVCRYRLKKEFNGKYEAMPIVTVEFSKRNRVGICSVPPVDPNNQDKSVLIGSEDISKMDRFEHGDPRRLSLNGGLNVGNRGMVEFIEVFKNETEYLHDMLTATQEKTISCPGNQSMIYVDEVILAHSNEAEWQKFKADHTNEALLDRIVVLKVPYNLRVSEEIKIYQKIILKSNFKSHVAPHTLEIASMFAILSRLELSPKCDVMTKMRLYNGEEVIEQGKVKNISTNELKDDAQLRNEGMNGISTRFIMKALDNALSENISAKCINPISVREMLIKMVKSTDLKEDVRNSYLEILQDKLHKEYLVMLEKDLSGAFIHAYEEQAEQIFLEYLDHARAFINKKKVRDAKTQEELEPNEGFLKTIEEHIGIVGSAAPVFRQEVISILFDDLVRCDKLSYKSYAPLKDAIEKKLMTNIKGIARIITKARVRDDEQQEKYDTMVKEMLELHY